MEELPRFRDTRTLPARRDSDAAMTNTISILSDLIETLKDGQEGFRAAAKDVPSHDLKTLFSEYSLQRSKFAGELQALAHSFGEAEPETGGGRFRRGASRLDRSEVGADQPG